MDSRENPYRSPTSPTPSADAPPATASWRPVVQGIFGGLMTGATSGAVAGLGMGLVKCLDLGGLELGVLFEFAFANAFVAGLFAGIGGGAIGLFARQGRFVARNLYWISALLLAFATASLALMMFPIFQWVLRVSYSPLLVWGAWVAFSLVIGAFGGEWFARGLHREMERDRLAQ